MAEKKQDEALAQSLELRKNPDYNPATDPYWDSLRTAVKNDTKMVRTLNATASIPSGRAVQTIKVDDSVKKKDF